jgi:hypothetical protein
MRFLHPRHGIITSEGLNRARFNLISMGRIRGSRRLDSRYVSIGVSKPGVCAYKVDEVSDHASDLSTLLIIARDDQQITVMHALL